MWAAVIKVIMAVAVPVIAKEARMLLAGWQKNKQPVEADSDSIKGLKLAIQRLEYQDQKQAELITKLADGVEAIARRTLVCLFVSILVGILALTALFAAVLH